MSKAMLVDTTRCTGCRGCQVACKQWNDKPGESTTYSPTGSNPPRLSVKTWTYVDFRPAERTNGQTTWSFVKRQCMHCLDPACVSACATKALTKTKEGPVIYRVERCFGCRYCMVACPFDVLRFEWDSANPSLQKCQFCFDRIQDGKEPACAKTCPTDAIMFGERDALLEEARTRVYSQPAKYVQHIYGEKEAGGTSWLYVSDVPFEDLGLPTNVKERPYPELTKGFLVGVPLVLLAWPVALAGVNALVKLRERGLNKGNGHDGEDGQGGAR
ncbi:MAG: 4Fe-4S dicluster domain-containing protein [Chloroflexota bacterium]|nr:4Fe-4S dicluster domain-containing protein [Chloroflexota bacterium]